MSQKGSAIARKTAARLAAVQVLYQMRLNNQNAKSALSEYASHRAGKDMDGDTLVTPDADLLDDIVNGVETRWADVDGIVSSALSDGGRETVEPLLDCILRAGVYEMIAHGSVDTGIIINDYLNVTVGFYEGTEKKLINAVLDKVGKTVR
ncbi:MAG: transcription antitermination protein NusB [Alphaproteobacteria bacterium]|nr:transcription antitermination protein NusB [Alphaproteobacteria bacterium]